MTKPKRQRMAKARPGQLCAKWTTEDCGDVSFAWGEGCRKSDSHLLMYALCTVKMFDGGPLLDELIARGYDRTTLRFSIRKTTPPEPTNDRHS